MTAKQEWAAHWRVVLGAGLAFATGYAAISPVSSLFIDGVCREFGLTRGQVSGYTAIGLLGAFSAPVLGRLTDRYGVRPIALVCFAAIGLIYLLQSQQTGNIPAFVALTFVFAMFGAGTGALTLTRAINSWFVYGRGWALSVALASVSVMSLILAPIMGLVIDIWSWRAGYFVLAGLTFGIGIPAIYFFVHERHDRPKPDVALPTSYPGKTLKGVWKSRDFVCLALGLFLMNMPNAGIVSQLAPLMTDAGFSIKQAAIMISIMTGAVLFGRLLSGWLVDRVSPVKVAVVFTTLPALGCILLLLDSAALFPVAAAAVALVGLQQGAETDLMAFFTARQFGLRRYATIFGVFITITLLSLGLGIAGFGQVFDRTGSYDLALIASAIAYPLAALSFLGVGKGLDAADEA